MPPGTENALPKSKTPFTTTNQN
ncbi:hypothetical protein PENSTE_c013G00242 [Penicillium steckii]|uniref:Uncharacterized protein n=1 Tax=Penicillium steckii TaxID=303698 RepID=A0A1V6T3J7_9EURO|nr:hypothetical protein PENSTE_c013G00242 [Penicillium steckii]